MFFIAERTFGGQSSAHPRLVHARNRDARFLHAAPTGWSPRLSRSSGLPRPSDTRRLDRQRARRAGAQIIHYGPLTPGSPTTQDRPIGVLAISFLSWHQPVDPDVGGDADRLRRRNLAAYDQSFDVGQRIGWARSKIDGKRRELSSTGYTAWTRGSAGSGRVSGTCRTDYGPEGWVPNAAGLTRCTRANERSFISRLMFV